LWLANRFNGVWYVIHFDYGRKFLNIAIAGDYFTEISPFVDYFFLETTRMAGYWNTKSDLNFNLKLAVGNFPKKRTIFLSLIFSQKEGVKYLSGLVKDPTFLSKLLVTVDPYALSFEHKDPAAEKILSLIVFSPKKFDKFLNVSKVSWDFLCLF
jgi:hypothetical protein